VVQQVLVQRLRRRSALLRDLMRDLDVGPRADGRQQVEPVKDEANLRTAQAGALRVVQAREVLPLDKERCLLYTSRCV